MRMLCIARDIEFEGKKLAEVTIEKTEQGEVILIFRAKLNPDSVTFGNNELKFGYREKKEQAPQTEQAKT